MENLEHRTAYQNVIFHNYEQTEVVQFIRSYDVSATHSAVHMTHV